METIVVGNGGRESELVRQLGLSGDVETVYCLDGNAGTDDLPKAQNVEIKPGNIDAIVDFADQVQAGLTVIGPEAPLVAGVADRLRQKGLTVFGPSAEAAQLEASKIFASKFMEEMGIPHPHSVFTDNYRAANQVVALLKPENIVIKADGLAGGKGVILPPDDLEAERALRSLMIDGGYGGAGKEGVLIQKRYHGPEVSVFVVSDGRRFTVLPFSQDHKRLLDGDMGPNTGGMGAYAPLPQSIVNDEQEQKIMDIAQRSIEGMARRGTPYQGVLYIGVMLAEELDGDPTVIEYNARFGDPETQVVLPLLSQAGVDVSEMLKSAAEGHLTDQVIPKDLGCAAVTVCMAAQGYPEKPLKGKTIYGLDRDYDGVIIHQAGTKKEDGVVKTSGGRVLYVTGIGETVDEAADKAYRAMGDGVSFLDAQYRHDIAHSGRT